MTALALSLLLAAPPECPLQVESVRPRPDLTKQFLRTDGWTGGDGAASISLTPNRTLWLFADSFIGRVENGRRVGARMVNNAVAWKSLNDATAPWRFFWNATGKEPAALIMPAARDEWYWPNEGTVVDGRLFLFCKVVKRKEEGAPGFQFDWVANDLVGVENPLDEPTAWRVTRRRLAAGPDHWRPGSACVVDGGYLYVYGLFPPAGLKPLESPLAVARIRTDHLAAAEMSGWEYWTVGDRWSNNAANLAPLFRDGGPDMSVCRVRGIDGFMAVYMPLGIGGEITIRHAPRPEGPWSEPVRVFRVPPVENAVFFYAPKAHSELSERDGHLILTYCRNIGALSEHVRRPDIYVPQFVEVQLRRR